MWLADAGYAMLPTFVTAQDLDFHPQKEDRDVRVCDSGQANGVLLGGDDHFQITADASVNETLDLMFRVTMVIGISLRELDSRALFAQTLFEAVRSGNCAKRPDIGVA